MKLNKLGLACAAALISSQALAFGPTEVPDLNIFISGATAQDKALAKLATDLCTDQLDTFKDGGTGKAYTSYFCTMDASTVTGLSGPLKVLINKRSAGGSGKGVQVVADAVAIEAMNINNGNCTDADANHVWDCDISGGTGDGDLIMQVSTAGISDVEPAMFVGPNIPAGDVAVTPDQIGKMDISTMNAVVFGVPATTHLYRALQRMQGLVADDATPDADPNNDIPDGTPINDAIVNMPSLSSAQVNGLITGGIKKWTNLIDAAGNDLTTFKAVGETLGSTAVHICRRVPGSGTQAQMNAVFANTPCAEGVKQPVRAPGSPLGPVVVENSGSGDVNTCLANFDNLASPKWAIGVQSLEKSSPNFRFVKIDGVAPTVQNVAENKYKDWVETSIQWRNAANAGPSGDTLVLLQKIAKDASTPATIATLNASLSQAFGIDGAYLALNTNGHVPVYPFDPSWPVTTATHAPLGVPNSCNPPQVNIKSQL